MPTNIWIAGGTETYQLVLSPQLVIYQLGGAKATGTTALFEIVGAGHVLEVAGPAIDQVINSVTPTVQPHPPQGGDSPTPVGGTPPPVVHYPNGPIGVHRLIATTSPATVHIS